MDKDKVLPQTGSNMTTQRPTRTNRVLTINPISIPIISLSNHLNGKIKSKQIGPLVVLTKERDEAIVAWVLSM